MPLRVQNPGYPDLRTLLCAGYVTRLKLTLLSCGLKGAVREKYMFIILKNLCSVEM